MVLLNLIRGFIMGLALYLILGVAFNDAHHWHWVNYIAYSGIWFGSSMAADAAELLVVKWFNPEEDTKDVYRG